MAEKRIRLAIKPQQYSVAQPCGICGEETEPQNPFDLFFESGDQIVCHQCAGKYAPELVSLMEYFYKGHYVEPAVEELQREVGAIASLAEQLQTDDFDQLEQTLSRLSRRSYGLVKFLRTRAAATHAAD